MNDTPIAATKFTWTNANGIADKTDIFGLNKIPKSFRVAGNSKTLRFCYSHTEYNKRDYELVGVVFKASDNNKIIEITLVND